MENIRLHAESRSADEKLSSIRSNKMVPGVVYGHSQEPITLKINYSDFLRTYRSAGESHIITLKVANDSMDVLVQEVQCKPVTGDYIHVDFYAITKGEKVTANINLEFTGESAASKEGAIIEEHMKEIEVKCFPKDLVDNFEVDLGKLATMGDAIRVSDLEIDESKYEVHAPAEEIVVAANAPKKEEVIEDSAPEAPEMETEEETEEK